MQRDFNVSSEKINNCGADMEIEKMIQVLSEQRDELFIDDLSQYCSRREEEQLSLTSSLAQVVIGVRRCGKSTLCVKFLRENDVKFAYVNLDDERLSHLSSEDLNTLLEAMYVVYGSTIKYFFFDEIQNADSWPLFVNRLLRQKKHIFVTGSNSKLLSNELMTHLTGRHNAVALFPFSFKEYCAMMEVDTKSVTTKAEAMRIEYLHKFLDKGGMPELLHEKNGRRYVSSLMNTIIRNDIAKRFGVRNVDALYKMATYLVDNFAQEFVPSKVGELFGLNNKTVSNYYRYLKEAFLLVGIPKFSFKAQERIRNEKCYVVDVAFPQCHSNAFSMENLGWKLENVVCIELLRRYNVLSNIFYYKERDFECDFVVASGSRVEELIQVSYDITTEKTRRREINGLLKASQKFNCNKLTLITFSTQKDIEINGLKIQVIGATDWLLNRY